MITFACFGLAHMHMSMLYGSLIQYPEEAVCIGWAETPDSDDQDYDKKARASLGRAYGKEKEYRNWLELADLHPDLALVCSDNASRADVACELIRRGISVALEKPMAMTYEDARRIADCANEFGVKLAVNWPIAWFPSFNLAKQLVDEGRIGSLMRVTYRSPATWGPFSYSADGSLPPIEELKKTWWYRPGCGGGSVLDYACYGAALATWFFGRRALSAHGITEAFLPEALSTGVEDYSAMLLDFGGGIGLLEGSWSTFNAGEVPTGPILHGTEGTIVCDRHADTVKLYRGKSHPHTAPDEVISCPGRIADKNFGRNILDYLAGKAPLHPMLEPEFNVSVMAALDAGRKDAETGGQPVVQ